MSGSRDGYLEDLLTRLRASVATREPALANALNPATGEGNLASHPFTTLNYPAEIRNAPTKLATLELIDLLNTETHATNPPASISERRASSEQRGGSAVTAHNSEVPTSQAPPLKMRPSFFSALTTEQHAAFFPHEPDSLAEAHLAATEVETLVLKYMLNRGSCTGRDIANQIRLSFKIIQEVMNGLRTDQLIVYKGSSLANDYDYQLTPAGREQARRLYEHSTYFGSAPVMLDDYSRAIAEQSLRHSQPTIADLKRAFKDLLIPEKMISRLAQAIHHGRGLFLYGAPGNGKTSIAQRITRAFGEHLWIPRTIGIDGDILRLYDPCVHEEIPHPAPPGETLRSHVDQRWICIRRPTILAGGELTMERLDVVRNTSTGTNEAPLQLKSNCGTLVIDDFGRQRMSVEELLNRWIVPLDKGYDFLNLPSGKTIQVPFDQMLVFSTNLEPRDLADEAFLRRIPYKLDISDPTEEHFRELMRREGLAIGLEFDLDAVDELIIKHYQKTQRAFRCCHPRDLLLQVRAYCQVHNLPLKMNSQAFDVAAENYFAVL